MPDHAELELQPMTEASITRLLLEKHRADIAIPQCKTGSTFLGSPGVIDLWVCPLSFSRPVIAYEIKVSRSDFRRDEKWREYLPFCDRLYFVTPWALVERSEIPEPAGLYYVSKDRTRLVHRKRPDFDIYRHARREQIPSSIFRYALLWRVAEVAKRIEGRSEDLEAAYA